jgi:arsenate reductase
LSAGETAGGGRGPRLLFVCVENSCRSQMAEAFARGLGGGRVTALSAGSRPSGRVNPRAVAAMAELGYDLTTHRSKSLEEVAPHRAAGSGPDSPAEPPSFDVVVTMGCGDACPWVPTARREDWALPDPKAMDVDGFRRVRDAIGAHVQALLDSLT